MPHHFSPPFVTLVISAVALGSQMKGPAALPLSTLLSRLPSSLSFHINCVTHQTLSD